MTDFINDLSLGDNTQVAIAKHLSTTQEMLADVASLVSGRKCYASVTMLPDLGMPHNVKRICGGFYTGAYYEWDKDALFVPVDATINIDSTSIFRIDESFSSIYEFNKSVSLGIECAKTSGYVWNFNVGNHFITYGSMEISGINNYYIAIHGSAAEFKKQSSGLYPSANSWFYGKIKTRNHPTVSGRYLRYVDGITAEQYVNIAESLEKYNKNRHYFFASSIIGFKEPKEYTAYTVHYGMPSATSVAIGCQLLRHGERFLLMTAPDAEMYFVEALPSNKSEVIIHGTPKQLMPHGFGKRLRSLGEFRTTAKGLHLNGQFHEIEASLAGSADLEIRYDITSSRFPRQYDLIREKCPFELIGIFRPIYSYNAHTCVA